MTPQSALSSRIEAAINRAEAAPGSTPAQQAARLRALLVALRAALQAEAPEAPLSSWSRLDRMIEEMGRTAENGGPNV